MALKNSKGFTLVEMLVVIAIISVLAAALFPAIQNAISTASATALKQKGRGVWVAITSANMEREPLNLGVLWPTELEEDASVGTAVAYFNYLLSDGNNTGTTTDDPDLRVVADLTPDALVASGVTAAKIGEAITENNIAWGVVKVQDSSPSEVPFLISRNYDKTAALSQQANPTTEALELNPELKPFNATRAVWVTRGGGVFDARKKYFTMSQLMGLGDSSVTYDYWAK
jgi:prepilin-type N-terminal cleavage/methylation domain-containing protein